MSSIEHHRRGLSLLGMAMATLCCLLSPTGLQGQQDAERRDRVATRGDGAALVGRVLSRADGRPVEGAAVKVRGTSPTATAVTDARGRYRLAGLPDGIHVLEVEELGGETRVLPVVLRRGHATRVTVRIAPDVVVMDEIEVTVNRGWRLEKDGFWDRKRTGMGSYLTPAEIERRDPHRTADLLSAMPGLNVGPAQQGHRSLRIGRAAGNRACEPVLFVNGHVTLSQRVDDIHAEDVLAIEVYRGPASLPARFHRNRGNSDCGAIVVWTKLREH